MINTPVVIIGAGPAGVGLSIFLSKAGIKHVIIERKTFPRDKVCGDALSGKTAFVLRKANPEWLQEIFQEPQKFTPSKGCVFAAPNGKTIRVAYGQHTVPGELAPGFTSPRLIFDNYLFNKIDHKYATVYQNATVNSIIRSNGNVTIEVAHENQKITFVTPLIVGADGDKSIVRKYFLNDNISEKSYTVGLRAYYENVTNMDSENYIELHFLKEMLPGYFWIFPLPNGIMNVGVGILAETVRRKKINLREQMLRAIEVNPTINYRFKNAKLIGKIQGWGLPMAVNNRSISGDNYLLLGDAASLIDPFSGEGIGNALYSGLRASEAIEKAMNEHQYGAAFLKANYDDVLYGRIGTELKISQTLQKLSKHTWFLNMLVNKANKSPSLTNVMSGMLKDMDLRAEFRKPSFYAKILFNK